jgi:DNA polymerase-3 subunit alpha
MFAQLHLHTHLGSRLDAVGSSNQYAEKAYKLGHKAVAITDHGRMTGIYHHQQACLEHGVKPIIGVEAYLNDNLVEYNEKKKRIRGKNSHIVLLAKNEIGYKNLLKLNYISMSDEDHFYYTNRITEDELFEYSQGLIIGSGCMQSKWGRLIRSGKVKEAEKLFEKYVRHFGEDFYAEVQLNELNYKLEDDVATKGQKSVNDCMIDFANKYGVPIVITGDVHYVEPGQDQLQTLSIAIRDKASIDNLNFEIESKHLYFHDESDYVEFNDKFGYGYNKSDIIQWANNAAYIAEKCDYQIPERRQIYLPSFTGNDDEELVRRSKEGLNKKFNGEVPEEYQARLKKELEVMMRKGFSSYILILEDMIKHVLQQGHTVGPGRGCFTGDSLVKMGDNTYKEIKDVEPGEYVISGTGSSRKCLDIFEYDIEEDIVEIEFEDGNTFECTKDHKILVLPDNKNDFLDSVWKEAKDLEDGDEIIKV